jgi:HD superfamily phosphohydrolase
MFPRKSICIPATPPVDVADFLPIIEHPHFQKLRERKQLGVNYLVFPGAVHTRFEHTIGVLALAQRLCRIHRLPDDDAKLIQAYAMVHDIGHGPFSHQVEPILIGDHHSKGLERILDMKDAIEACGCDSEHLIQMLQGDNPLAKWISDRNLGADKLDYLMRDALHIGFHGTPDIEKIQFYTRQVPQGLAIEQKFIEDAKQLQKFYSYLHQHGYLNKTALAAQRMLQRAVQQELMQSSQDPAQLWDMTDQELHAWLYDVKAKVSKKLSRKLFERDLHKTFLALKPPQYEYVERVVDKPIVVNQWSKAELRRFSEFANDTQKLLELEDKLAQQCNAEPGDILFAAMPYFKKLLPEDLIICSDHSERQFSLLQNDTDHLKSLESDYLRTFAVRLVAPTKLREKLAKQADSLQDSIKTAIG